MKKLISKYIPKDYSTLLQWVMYFWAGSICFPALQGSFYGVFALLLWGVFKGHIGFSFNYRHRDDRRLSDSDENRNRIVVPVTFWKSRKTPFYFLLAYLLWMTATIFWSDNIREYFRQFEKLIPLYLLAFIGFMEGIDKHINLNKVLNAFLWGVLIAIGYMVVRMGVDMFVGDMIGRIKAIGFFDVNIIEYLGHRSYIGAVFLVSVSILVEQTICNYKYGGKSYIFIVFVVLVLTVCFMSGARIIMTLVFALPVVLMFVLIRYKYVKLKLVFSVVFFVTFIAFMSTNYRVSGNIEQLKNGIEYSNIDSRFYIWELASLKIKENLFCGVGLGDMEDVMLKQYRLFDKDIAYEKKMNCHNQYLQIILGGGLIALLLFISTFYFLYKNSDKNKFIIFIVVFASVSLFESILVRNIGVFSIVFFSLIFSKNIKNNDSQKFNYNGDSFIFMALIAIIILMIFYLGLSKTISLKTQRPNTYINRGVMYVKNKHLPLGDDNPISCDGALIDYRSKNLWIGSNNEIRYVRNDFLVENLELSKPSNVVFSLWCYIPVNSKLKTVKIGYTDGNTTSVRNFGNIYNEWIKLTVSGIQSLDETRFFLLTECEAKNVNDTNMVYFAKPEIIINDKTYICN